MANSEYNLSVVNGSALTLSLSGPAGPTGSVSLADPAFTGEVVINTLVGVNKDSLTINNTSDGDGLHSYGLKINKSGVDSIGLDVYVGPNIENGIGVYSNVSGESSIGLVSIAYGDSSKGAAINSSGYETQGLTITSSGSYSTGIVVESSGTENVGMLINSTVGDYQAIFSDMATRKSFVARLNGAFGWFRGTLLGAMFTGRIQAADTLTEDRTYTLPDASGTVALINPSTLTQTFSGAQAMTGSLAVTGVLSTSSQPVRIPLTYSNASDFTTASTTFVDVTNLSFSVLANKNYQVFWNLITNKNDANGLQLQVAGPASPTKVLIRQLGTTSSITSVSTDVILSFSSASSVLNTYNGDGFSFVDCGIISNGANNGTVRLQLKAVTGGTAKIYAGSWIQVTQLN